MSLLVTGAAGFLGGAVMRALAARFPGEAVVAVDLETPRRANGPGRLCHVDVADATAVSEMMEALRPRVIVHAAAMTPTPEIESAQAPRIVAVNVAGTAAVMQAAAAVGVRRCLLVSSQAVYGTSPSLPDPVPETTPPAPETLYGITKLAAESVAQRIAALHGISCAVVRVASLYGLSECASASRPRPTRRSPTRGVRW